MYFHDDAINLSLRTKMGEQTQRYKQIDKKIMVIGSLINFLMPSSMTKKNVTPGAVHHSCWQSLLAILNQLELFCNMQPMLIQRTEKDGQVFIVA